MSILSLVADTHFRLASRIRESRIERLREKILQETFRDRAIDINRTHSRDLQSRLSRVPTIFFFGSRNSHICTFIPHPIARGVRWMKSDRTCPPSQTLINIIVRVNIQSTVREGRTASAN